MSALLVLVHETSGRVGLRTRTNQLNFETDLDLGSVFPLIQKGVVRAFQFSQDEVFKFWALEEVCALMSAFLVYPKMSHS